MVGKGCVKLQAIDASFSNVATPIDPDIMSVLSHELISPLTLIKGYAATLLQLGAAITEEQKKRYLRGIESATSKLTNILENFRDISLLEDGNTCLFLQITSLPDLLLHAISEIQTQTTKHVIKLRLVHPLPLVNVDRRKIEQLISNLLVNAIKYSPDGGNIEVTAQQLNDGEGVSEICRGKLSIRVPSIIVRVNDSGLGVPKEEIERIFEKFYRLENKLTSKISGAGLGLYICKMIVEKHGGHIYAESRVGKGSTFNFSLPIVA